MSKTTLHLRFSTQTGAHRALGPFLRRALPTYPAPPGGRVRLLRCIELRYLSYVIDSALLTAALMLMTIVHQFRFVHGWLTVRVLLLVAYIALGFAL